MARPRLELQNMLEEMLGSRNVYFQPPPTIVMKYPSIVYQLVDIRKTYADSDAYLLGKYYQLTLIDKDIESPIVDKLLRLKYCEFDRFFVSDNLNHFVFKLYF